MIKLNNPLHSRLEDDKASEAIHVYIFFQITEKGLSYLIFWLIFGMILKRRETLVTKHKISFLVIPKS